MGRHRDQIDVQLASRLHDLVGRVASEQHACDRNPIQLRPQRPIQISLGPLDDVRVQIPRRDLVPVLQRAGGIAERRHHVQQDHFRMKAARQPGGLVHYLPGSIREHNRNKNFLNAQHRAICRLTEPMPSGARPGAFREAWACLAAMHFAPLPSGDGAYAPRGGAPNPARTAGSRGRDERRRSG